LKADSICIGWDMEEYHKIMTVFINLISKQFFEIWHGKEKQWLLVEYGGQAHPGTEPSYH